MKLLTPAASNAKTAKNASQGAYLSYILHLAPSRLSGFNTCPKASAGCAAACLNTAGRGAFNNVQQARINKTKRLFLDKSGFMADLFKDLAAVERKAAKLQMKAVVRLNGTSDLDWTILRHEGLNPFEAFPNIQFYDYTAVYRRLEKSLIYPNYHLTFSRKENNDQDVMKALDLGFNVAAVFKAKELPSQAFGIPVQRGDDHDLRFLDAKIPNGSWVGLLAKGKAKRDNSGFAITLN